jgi:hypothetical protein
MRPLTGRKPAPALGFPLWRVALQRPQTWPLEISGPFWRLSPIWLLPPQKILSEAAEAVFKRSVRQIGAGEQPAFWIGFERVLH